MPSPPGSHFVVHGTTASSTSIDYGPFNNLNDAQQAANGGINSGEIIDYFITYQDVHGNTVTYENT